MEAGDQEDGEEAEEELPEAAAAMTPEDLAAARHQRSATGAVLTHRLRVYFVPRDTAPELLAGCANFASLSELQRLRLLRELQVPTPPPEPEQQQHQEDEDAASSSSRLMRCLNRHRLLGQLTQGLEPIGRLPSCCRGQCEQSLMKLLQESDRCSADPGECQVIEVASRHLRRLQTQQPLMAGGSTDTVVCGGGNERPFPLACGLSPESLRLDIHQQPGHSWVDIDIISDHCDRSDGGSSGTNATPPAGISTISDADLYRPYLNNWVPLKVHATTADAAAAAAGSAGGSEEVPDGDRAVACRQRLLAVVGALTWRQKQHRQQRLAVRLATRSALINLRHSISVQPAKNYLELYVNMISRAVELAAGHVRRWSHSLEHSWKAFKELAAAAAAPP